MLNLNELERPPKRKRSRRSFLSEAVTNVDIYVSSKRVPPSAKNVPVNEAKKFMFDDCFRQNFFGFLMRSYAIPSSIPRWTGFYVEMSNNIPIMKTSIRYLDSINSPATEMSSIYKICFQLFVVLLVNL